MDEIIAVRVASLTDAQQRLLRLTAGGATPTDIADRLDLPPQRVQHELGTVLDALGVRDIYEAAIVWWGSRAGARLDLAAAAQELMG